MRKAFTLIECFLCISIFAIIVAIALSNKPEPVPAPPKPAITVELEPTRTTFGHTGAIVVLSTGERVLLLDGSFGVLLPPLPVAKVER